MSVTIEFKLKFMKAYNCEPRRRIRRSSSTIKTGLLALSGLGELSFCGWSSDDGIRNDDRLEAWPPPPPEFCWFETTCEACAKIPGAKTSYAEALQINKRYSFKLAAELSSCLYLRGMHGIPRPKSVCEPPPGPAALISSS